MAVAFRCSLNPAYPHSIRHVVFCYCELATQVQLITDFAFQKCTRSGSLMPPPFTVFRLVLFFCCANPFINAATNTARDLTILQIEQLITNGDVDSARALLAKAEREFPADAGLDNLSGVLAAQQHSYADAERSFHLAIQRDPRLTAAYLNLGRLYQENAASDPHATEKALKIYGRVLEYDEGNAEANYQSATLLQQSGQYQQSLFALKRLPSGVQETAQVLSLYCADAAALGKREQAEDALRRLTIRSDFSEADVRQMLPALHAGKRDDLLVAALEALQQREKLPADLMHTLALSYEATGKLNEARSSLEESATEGNLSVTLVLDLARVAHKQKDYEASIGYLAHARDLQPADPSIHYSFGMVCLDLELIAEARNSFEKALKLDPENPSYNYVMGVTSSFERDPADAVPYLKKYLELRPQDPRGQLALGAVLFRAKDYNAATPLLSEAVKAPATATAAHYYLGALSLRDGRLDEAADHLRLALKTNPEYADALAELGHYYLLRKNYAESEAQLHHALQVEPDHFSASFYLLTLYTRTGDSRREAQAKRYDDLQKLREQKSREFLRMIEVQPLDERH
jgi:tetratricopeptide (TPR) repeat protein